jgi:hypothetical protein
MVKAALESDENILLCAPTVSEKFFFSKKFPNSILFISRVLVKQMLHYFVFYVK